MVVTRAGDHRRVVRAQARRRIRELEPTTLSLFVHPSLELRIRRNSTGNRDPPDASLLDGSHGSVRQHVHHGGLEAGRYILDPKLGASITEEPEHRRFEPAEAEVQRAVQLRAGEMHSFRVAIFGQSVDNRPAGIAQSDRPCRFVERFARRVVSGATEDTILAVSADKRQIGVAAGDNETYKGKLKIRVAKEVGVNVALQVVDTNEREVEDGRDGLRGRDTDQESTKKAGPVRYSDRLDLSKTGARRVESFLEDWINQLDMLARRDFGDNAAEPRMQINLGGHDVGKDFASVLDDRRGSLIAARFDPKYVHASCASCCLRIRKSRRKSGLRMSSIHITRASSLLSV